ncbi:hypothetical protein ACVWXO_002627 [Bradyrhizobium sp. LM2.7]
MSDDLLPLIPGIHDSICCLGARPAVLSHSGSRANPFLDRPAIRSSCTGKTGCQEVGAEAKPVAKQPIAVESGPCRLGVIPVIGDHYSVQKFGLTIFENEASEVAVDWSLDDLVFARVRAATNNDPAVRRIAYPKGISSPSIIRKRSSSEIPESVCR